jgi:PAS domain S-box-containing protein
MNIGRKLTFWIILVVFLIGVFSTYFFVRMETANETTRLESLGNVAGLIVEKSLDNYMMVRDFTVLDKTMHDLRDMRSIRSISLINREGIIKISTDKDKEGLKMLRNGPGCTGCHETGRRGLSLKRERIFRWVQPIRNKPECFRCHSPSIRNNGIFIIDFSLAEWEREVKKEAMMGFSVLIPSLTVIGLVMLYLTRNLLIKRLAVINDGVEKFREGSYGARIPSGGSNDEITQLEKGFNEMAEAISARNNEKDELLGKINSANDLLLSEVQERKQAEKELRRNYDTQSVINALLHLSQQNIPLDDILRKSLDLILSIPWLSLESRGAVFLMDDAHKTLVLKAQKGLSIDLQEKCGTLPLGRCLCGRSALTREIQFADRVDKRHEVTYQGMVPHGHYCVPVIFSETTLGVITVYLKEGHARNEREEAFLNAIANALAGIIQRKRIEEEREKLIGDLRITLGKVSRSQRTWQETFDSIGDMISIHDKDFNIIRVNRAFAEYFSLDPGEVIHKKCYEFFHSGDSPAAGCPHLLTLKENRPATHEILDAKTGRIFLISIFPFHVQEAEFQGTIHIAKDITEEREREMRLIMSERLASLGQMASGIAHEINNPLAAIAGCAEGLLNRVEKDRYNPELFRNYLKIIEEEILRCKSITTSMLSFVRETTYEKKMVDIAEMLDKTLEIIGFQGRLKDVEVHNDYMAGLPLVHGSEGELRQVFLSVITNALDAMNDRGTLTIRTGTDGKAVFIKIGDSGPGIPPENINRIFDPFFTSKSAAGGTGLGLSIAGKIISNHKGKIDVVSRENEGAVFTITLPLPDEDKSGKTTS